MPRHVTASFGISCLHAEDGDIKELLARADKALYAAKRNGRNKVEVFSPWMGQSTLAA
jgi:diguanylate cyclase (GGDEF)-like protein